MRRNAIRLVPAIVLLLMLAACKSFKPWPMSELFPSTKLAAVGIHSTADSNGRAVALVDILFDLGKDDDDPKVPQKTKDWYADRDALLFSLANTTLLVSYQVPPGRDLRVTLPKGYKQARQVLLFVDFQKTGGYFEADLTAMKRIRVDLSDKKVDIVKLK